MALAHGPTDELGEYVVLAREVEVEAASGDLGRREDGPESSQVAIAWTMAHRPWVHPILGASRPE